MFGTLEVVLQYSEQQKKPRFWEGKKEGEGGKLVKMIVSWPCLCIF